MGVARSEVKLRVMKWAVPAFEDAAGPEHKLLAALLRARVAPHVVRAQQRLQRRRQLPACMRATCNHDMNVLRCGCPCEPDEGILHCTPRAGGFSKRAQGSRCTEPHEAVMASLSTYTRLLP